MTTSPVHWAGLFFTISMAQPAFAEQQKFEYGDIDVLFEDSNQKSGHISFGYLDSKTEDYFGWKSKVAEKYDLTYVIEDRLIAQWAHGSSVIDNEVNLIGRWEPIRDTEYGSHSLNIWGQFAQSLGGTTASEFQSDLGVLSPLNGGNGGPSNTNEILQMLAWEYKSVSSNLRTQIGKLSSRTLVNLNRYANGDSEMFFSPMLGNNVVAPYTALLGLGGFAQWKSQFLSLSGMARAHDVETGLSLNAVENGDWAYVFEVIATPTIPELGLGNYRFTYSFDHSTSNRPMVTSYSLSFDQDLGDSVGGFLKWSYSDNTFRSFENQMAIGFQIKEPLGFKFDRLGLGVWLGRPSDGDLDSEQGIEVFYKAQIKSYLEITPDLQMVANPALSNDSTVFIAGVRLRIVM